MSGKDESCLLYTSSRIGYSKEIMIYQLVAIFVSLLFITPKKVQYPNFRDKNQMRIDLGIFNKIIYILLILSLVFVAYYVSNQGYTGKSEIYDAGPLWVRIVFRFPLIISILYTMSIINYYSEHKYLPKKQMSLVGGALLIITLFSGERDFVFRFIIITIMLLWMLKKLTLIHISLVGEKAVNGIFGKIVDVFSVVVSFAGVATSLGLGVSHISGGLNFLWEIPNQKETWFLIIFVITCIFLARAISGVNKGIKILSKINTYLAFILLFLGFILGPTSMIFSNFVNGIGQHLQNFVGDVFMIDPFGDKMCIRDRRKQS